jgi:hypothetical protein
MIKIMQKSAATMQATPNLKSKNVDLLQMILSFAYTAKSEIALQSHYSFLKLSF